MSGGGLSAEEREMYGWEVEGQWVTGESGVLALSAAREAKARAETGAAYMRTFVLMAQSTHAARRDEVEA